MKSQIKNTILAIDTATEYLSLAIKNDQIEDFILLKVGNTHSDKIIQQINQLLEKHNLAVSNLKTIAYNKGPGAFTGLRIGLSIAIGISIGLNIPLIPVPSFAIYANSIKNIAKGNKVLVGIDARLNQVYLAGINFTDFSYFMDPQLVNPQDIIIPDDCSLSGNAFHIYRDTIPKLSDKFLITDNYPNAINLIDLMHNYNSVNAQNAELLYLRDKIALNLEEQNATKNISNR